MNAYTIHSETDINATQTREQVQQINANKKVSYCKQIARQHSFMHFPHIQFDLHVQNLVVVSHNVGPKNFGLAAALPLAMGTWLMPRNMLLPTLS